jgi:Winged helix DNA-binding domain
MQTPERLRAWWWHKQGLDGTLAGASASTVLATTGWARSVGGVNPYLTLFARADLSQAAVESAVRALEIYELPAARGCTYVVPHEHFGLALQVGKGAAEADVRTLEKLGVPRGELEKLGQAVLDVLGSRELDPAALKEELGDAVRNLGEAGRKRGAATTLPATLGLLQASAEIRRVPVNGRLDQQRYAYTRWDPPRTPWNDDQARTELARMYFRWTGPASAAHLRWFTAFSAATAKKIIGELDLVDTGGGLLLPADEVAEFQAYQVPARPRYHLLAGIDALILLRRDLPALVDPADLDPVTADVRAGSALTDLPDHMIVDRGRIVGLWQFDPGAGQVVWWTYTKPDEALRAEVARTEAYLREQLGDARSFSLDSPKSRQPRLTALRAAAT